MLRACIATGDASPPAHELAMQLARSDPAQLAAAAHFHGISGYVQRSLRALDTDEAAAALTFLEPYRGHAIRSHLHALADLREARGVLNEAGLGWLVFKGPALVAAVHGTADLRTYSDLDLLIAPGDFQAAVEVFESAGYQILDRNWVLLRRELRGELHSRLPHGTIADLHWTIIHERPYREAFHLRTEDMLSRAESLTIDGQTIRTLDPVDTLLHLSVHTVLSGGHRLLWFKDVERLIATGSVDWDAVVTRASATRVGPLVALVLRQTRRLLGADLPRGVMEALAASHTWQQMTDLAYRLSPPQRSFGYGSVARMVSRATRPTLAASVEELVRRSAQWLRHVDQPRVWDGAVLDPRNPGSMSYAAGDAVDRAAFFDAVARQR